MSDKENTVLKEFEMTEEEMLTVLREAKSLLRALEGRILLIIENLDADKEKNDEHIRNDIASVKEEQRDIRELYYRQSEKIRELKDKINVEAECY